MPTRCVCGCRALVAKGGCFIPGHQPVGTSHDPLGKMKAANKIGNAKNNAKVQEHARVENEERIAKMSKKEAIISKAINKPLSELLGGK